MESRLIDVPGPEGVVSRIRVYHGGSGPELLFLHGAGGLLPADPFLNQLAGHFSVYAPLLPGFEDSDGGEHLRTMLDFTLHAGDVWEALELKHPVLVGHSMGGMIAAEMAAVAPHSVQTLVLLAPAGLWRDDYPVADLFAALPFELPALLLHDPEKHGALLSAGGDLDDPEFLTGFLVGNAQRLGTAGKLLFPIPDRGLATRLHRIQARTAVVWGTSDRLINPVYADEFARRVHRSHTVLLDEAGHMVPYEQTSAVVEIITSLQN